MITLSIDTLVLSLNRAIANRRPGAVLALYAGAIKKELRKTTRKGFKHPDPDWSAAPLARDYFMQVNA